MNQKSNWKFLNLDAGASSAPDSVHKSNNYSSGSDSAHNSAHHTSGSDSAHNFAHHTSCSDSAHNFAHHISGSDSAHTLISRPVDSNSTNHPPSPGSSYLIAQKNPEVSQKELLYKILAPIFFGQKQAENTAELAALFLREYGIDVTGDFFEGDEHYEEYQEACQALAEGMSIYQGSISFDNCVLAELADAVWGTMEKEGKQHFRRINTLLEE